MGEIFGRVLRTGLRNNEYDTITWRVQFVVSILSQTLSNQIIFQNTVIFKEFKGSGDPWDTIPQSNYGESLIR